MKNKAKGKVQKAKVKAALHTFAFCVLPFDFAHRPRAQPRGGP